MITGQQQKSVSDLNRLSILNRCVFEYSNNIHSFGDLAKDNMLPIEMFSWNSSDEKLGTICVCTSICHR